MFNSRLANRANYVKIETWHQQIDFDCERQLSPHIEKTNRKISLK